MEARYYMEVRAYEGDADYINMAWDGDNGDALWAIALRYAKRCLDCKVKLNLHDKQHENGTWCIKSKVYTRQQLRSVPKLYYSRALGLVTVPTD